MFQAAPLESAQALYDSVMKSPHRNTLLSFLLLFIGIIFMFGLCFGRVTKRLRTELKNKWSKIMHFVCNIENGTRIPQTSYFSDNTNFILQLYLTVQSGHYNVLCMVQCVLEWYNLIHYWIVLNISQNCVWFCVWAS